LHQEILQEAGIHIRADPNPPTKDGPQRAVKHGERYACTECGAVWYLHQGAPMQRMMWVPKACEGLFGMWSLRAVNCPPQLLDPARAIRASRIPP
jgi:hypothetical protein